MNFDRITINPEQMNGQPCIRGMRITVRRVLEALAVYPDREELKREYPEIEDEDIRQALGYAAARLDGGDSTYRIPSGLSDFQRTMYIHLIEWKWKNLTKEPGYFANRPYDAILPDSFKNQHHPIYPPIVERFLGHKDRFHVKPHTFIGHMASSQAACVNLFLPLLEHPEAAAKVMRTVKPDLHKIATDEFDGGFRLEFWDDRCNCLQDHTPAAGTDADIAIAYYDQAGTLKLWLIEHKLTESEFTTCGGYHSRGRDRKRYPCTSTADVVADTSLCYYHDVCRYRYWDITLKNADLFPPERLHDSDRCLFQGGMNQLWRNQLLAISIERSNEWPYEEACFSVVKHPANHALNDTICQFRQVVGGNGRFSDFTSSDLVNVAIGLDFTPWQDWLHWYRELYLDVRGLTAEG